MTSQYPFYTTNLCPNGSFEADPIGPLSPAGWSTITGEEQTYIQAYGDALPQYGNQTLQVTTPGLVSGEGVYGPLSPLFTTTATGSMTIGLLGQTGTLIVTANYTTNGTYESGVALASQIVQLDNEFNYTTITLNNLTIPDSVQMYIIVQTVSAESLTFFVDGVMYEPESPAHPYIDSTFPGCYLSGTLGQAGSYSYQQYQFPMSGTLGFIFGGSVNFIDIGEVFPWTTLDVTEFVFTPEGEGGSANPTWNLQEPIAAMTDFAIFNPGLPGAWPTSSAALDPDPALTYALWNNQDVLSGYNGYSRPYAMVVPPIDYPTSNGNFAWMRAAYMGLGLQFLSQASGISQVVTDVQLEYAAINGSNSVGPSAFQRPRQLQVIVKPNRLNYITNPSFESALTGWTQSGGTATLTQVTTPAPPQNVATYQNVNYSPGTHVMSVELPTSGSSGAGAQISVPLLIPGEIYIASAYVQPNQSFAFTATKATPCVFTAAGMNFSTNTIVQLYGTSLPGGFAAGTNYYVVNISGSTFQLAATASGTGIASATTGSGSVYWPELSDIYIECGGAAGDIVGAVTEGPDFIPPGATPYGGEATGFLSSTPYGSGPYGGLGLATTPLPPEWFRISCVFTATSDTATLQITAGEQTSPVYPAYFYVDAVLCELGDTLQPYFDGNSGPDAFWEYTNGTTAPVAGGGTSANLSRSYYYQQLEYGQHVVTDALNANTPMGISYATPLYGTVPTQ